MGCGGKGKRLKVGFWPEEERGKEMGNGFRFEIGKGFEFTKFNTEFEFGFRTRGD